MPRIPMSEHRTAEQALLRHLTTVQASQEGRSNDPHPCPLGPTPATTYAIPQALVPFDSGDTEPRLTLSDWAYQLQHMHLPSRLTSYNAPDHPLGRDQLRTGLSLRESAAFHDPIALHAGANGVDYPELALARYLEPWKVPLVRHGLLSISRQFRREQTEVVQAANLARLRQCHSRGWLHCEDLVQGMEPGPAMPSDTFAIGDLRVPKPALLDAMQGKTLIEGLACACGEPVKLRPANLTDATFNNDGEVRMQHSFSESMTQKLRGWTEGRPGFTCWHLKGVLPSVLTQRIHPAMNRWRTSVLEAWDAGLLDDDDVLPERYLFDENAGVIDFAFAAGAWMIPEMGLRFNESVRDGEDRLFNSHGEAMLSDMVLVPAIKAFAKCDIDKLSSLRGRIKQMLALDHVNVLPVRAMSVWVDAAVFDERRVLKHIRQNPEAYLSNHRQMIAERLRWQLNDPLFMDVWGPMTVRRFKDLRALPVPSRNTGKVNARTLPRTYNRLRTRLYEYRRRGHEVTLTSSMVELIEPFVLMGLDLEEEIPGNRGPKARYRFRFDGMADIGVHLGNARLVDALEDKEYDVQGQVYLYKAQKKKKKPKRREPVSFEQWQEMEARMQGMEEAGFELGLHMSEGLSQ